MYLDHFGLRQKPFLITPDPAFLYPSQGHQQALAHLHYGLEREGGFVLLTGEVGTGKTTLCRLLIDQLPDNFRLAYILNTKLDSVGVLAGICRELGIAHRDGEDANGLVAGIYDNLLETHSAGRHTLVVIEEAQNLAPEVLETLRLLTNLETATTKLLHILLVGQPELLDTLAQPGLRQLNQRVVSRCHLGPLSRGELHHYLCHRVKMAGGGGQLFSPGAIALIHRKTGGVPRLVNLLAEHCLMGAYALGRKTVTTAIARQGAREILTVPRAAPTARHGWCQWVATVVLVAVAAGGIYVGNNRFFPAGAAIAPAPAEAAPAVAAADSIHTATAPLPDSPLLPGPSSPADGQDLQVVAQQQAVAGQTDTSGKPVHPGAFQVLLQAWGVGEIPASLEDACAIALAQELRCETMAIASLEDVVAINRPILLSLRNGNDGLEYAVVTAVNGGQLQLESSQGPRLLPVAEVLARQQGDGVLVWQPPAGYDQPLVPGARNASLVAVVMEALTREGYLQDALVTGGVYSDFLVERVRQFQKDRGLAADGIVGVKTLLQLGGADEPMLVMGQPQV